MTGISGDPISALTARLGGRAPSHPADRRANRGALIRRALITSDATALLLAFFVAALIFGPGAGAHNRFALGAEYGLFLLTLPFWALGAKLYELYDRDEERTEHSTLDDFFGVLHLITIGVWVLYLGVHLTGFAQPEVAKAATFWALALLFVTAGRAAARAYCRRQPEYIQKTLIVGAGEVGQLVARKFQQHGEYGIDLVGFVDDEPLELRPDLRDVDVVGTEAEIESIIREHAVERVVIAFSSDSTAESVQLIRRLKAMQVQIDVVPRLFDAIGPNVTIHSVEGVALMGLPSSKLLPYSRGIKRAVDIAGALALLVVTAPLFALIAWRVRRDSPGPVFFRQARLGEGMREFEALKFRTMYVDTDDAAHREFIQSTMSSSAAPAANGLYKLERTDSITDTGRWLRRTSLDELPNLINVLRGEMSLVGPRPCIRYEVDSFQPHHFERFLVPAGITGLWQVTARAHSTFGEALDMDVAYARNWSLGLDLSLLLKTPFKVLKKSATR